MRCVLIVLVAAFLSREAVAAAPVTCVRFSPDGKQVIAVSQAGVAVYAWPSLKKQTMFRLRLPHATHLHFSPDGSQFFVTGGGPSDWGGIQIVDWPYKAESQPRVISFGDDALSQAVKVDNDRWIVAGVDGRLAMTDREGSAIREFKGHSRHVRCLALSGEDETLVSGGDDSSLRVWNVKTGELQRTLNQHTSAVRDLAFRPLGDGPPTVASAGADKTVRLWQPKIGRLVRFARLESPPLSIAWTPEGDRLLACCEDGSLCVIDPLTVKVVQSTHAIDGWAYAVASSPDGKFAVIGGEGGQVKKIAIGITTTPDR